VTATAGLHTVTEAGFGTGPPDWTPGGLVGYVGGGGTWCTFQTVDHHVSAVLRKLDVRPRDSRRLRRGNPAVTCPTNGG
jgi:hypothetical protein